jgi:hypothetical protein
MVLILFHSAILSVLAVLGFGTGGQCVAFQPPVRHGVRDRRHAVPSCPLLHILSPQPAATVTDCHPCPGRSAVVRHASSSSSRNGF